MGYTLEINDNEKSINKGMKYKMWNEDNSLYVFLQSSHENKQVTAIYKSYKNNLTESLMIAELFSIREGTISADSNLPYSKCNKLNVNKELFNKARDLFDIEWFRRIRNKKLKDELSINKGHSLQQDTGAISKCKGFISQSSEQDSYLLI